MFLAAFTPSAGAASFDEQIKQLKNESVNAAQEKEKLSTEALTLSGKVQDLKREAATLDRQIGDTKNRVKRIKSDIRKAEAEIKKQRKLLGVNVRKLYTEQDISTIEMLASSRNFSRFVDLEQYRSELQQDISDKTKRITMLKKEMGEEKKSIENLLSDQEAMQRQANKQRAEAQKLLGLNKEQQRVYQNDMKEAQAKEAELRRKQAKENKKGQVSQPSKVSAAAPPKPRKPEPSKTPQAPHGSQYPWANVPFPNTSPDPWGMFKRQCVSYTAWKVAASGRHMPYWGGRGNAKLWDDNARRAGIPVDTNPRVGDVAISNAGTYGHAMYVEAVHGDGTITISQYNAGWGGKYSEVRRSAAGLNFIHFS